MKLLSIVVSFILVSASMHAAELSQTGIASLPASGNIIASISNYRIPWAEELAKGNDLIFPKIPFSFGKEIKIQCTRELVVISGWNPDKTPKGFSREDLGAKIVITVHKDGDKMFYWGQLQLAQNSEVIDNLVPIQKSLTPFKGSVKSSETIHIPAVSPSGEKIVLNLNLKEV